ncbi:MAG TPA: chromate transporter, partial [Opitutaceae bacterium]
MAEQGKLTEVGWAFLRLGFTCFGGPTAHLGYFQGEFVGRREWLDEEAYADLVALCQVLPGPTSSQVAFGLGLRRAGVAGALLASVAFMLPSAAAMILFAYGVGTLGDPSGSGWLHGLRLAAVAVVALAVSGMASKLCPDWRRRIMA